MYDNYLLCELKRYIGQTVTIFTTSGGESGSGFTGVLFIVNPCYVRLVTQIGPAPGCALGNCCSGLPGSIGNVDRCVDSIEPGRANCGCCPLGSVVDIPVNKIASFVHNAV